MYELVPLLAQRDQQTFRPNRQAESKRFHVAQRYMRIGCESAVTAGLPGVTRACVWRGSACSATALLTTQNEPSFELGISSLMLAYCDAPLDYPRIVPCVRGHVKVLAGGQEKSSRW